MNNMYTGRKAIADVEFRGPAQGGRTLWFRFANGRQYRCPVQQVTHYANHGEPQTIAVTSALYHELEHKRLIGANA